MRSLLGPLHLRLIPSSADLLACGIQPLLHIDAARFCPNTVNLSLYPVKNSERFLVLAGIRQGAGAVDVLVQIRRQLNVIRIAGEQRTVNRPQWVVKTG